MLASREGTTARVRRSAWLLLNAVALVVFATAAHAAKYQPEVVVTDPYIELHTGPGRGYPIFYVAAQGDRVTILKEQTDWYKVRVPRGKEGWVYVSQLRSTLDLDGNSVAFPSYGMNDFEKRRVQIGFSGGDFDGARVISLEAAIEWTPVLTTEVSISQLLGDYSDGYLGEVSILMSPCPEWRVSPFFELGTGIIHIEPQTTIVQTKDRTDEAAHAGIGANIYLTKRFIFRMEYQRLTVLTSRDDNQEIDEWKAGFSIFL